MDYGYGFYFVMDLTKAIALFCTLFLLGRLSLRLTASINKKNVKADRVCVSFGLFVTMAFVAGLTHLVEQNTLLIEYHALTYVLAGIFFINMIYAIVKHYKDKPRSNHTTY